jgi:GT2 family glycosyltransferase
MLGELSVKLSIIILVWNDKKVIFDCLKSIYASTHKIDFEIIVSDNGSTDGSIERIRQEYPKVRILENGSNLRFAKGNNVAIDISHGEYVLILNPDTIIHEGALDTIVAYADSHPEGGAFSCRVLNSDGTFQGCIRPLPTVRSEWCLALGLGQVSRVIPALSIGEYVGWDGKDERTVGWLAGCFILIRGDLVKKLRGFDPQFFYYFEDTDLCHRVWDAGYTIRYYPGCSITHLGGMSTIGRFTPISFALDAAVTRYLYYYKYFGMSGIESCRSAVLVGSKIRRAWFGLVQILHPTEAGAKKLELLRNLDEWHSRVDLHKLVERGEEPEIALKPSDRVLER